MATRGWSEDHWKSERDKLWVEVCRRYFEGVRDNYIESGFPSLPDFVIHEIWKRDPKVSAERERLEVEVIRPLVEALEQAIDEHLGNCRDSRLPEGCGRVDRWRAALANAKALLDGQ